MTMTKKRPTSLYIEDTQREQLELRGDMSTTIRESLDRYFTLLTAGERALRALFTPEEWMAVQQLCGSTAWQSWSIRHLPDEVREAITDGDCPLPDEQGSVLAEKIERLELHQLYALVDLVERDRRALERQAADGA